MDQERVVDEPITRESLPDVAQLLTGGDDDDDGGQQVSSREYWELEGSPTFDMRSGRIERHDVTRSFICRTPSIPTLIEDAVNQRLEWGQGPSYKGEIIGVRLKPIGAPKGDKVASYDYWQVDLLYGSVTPVVFQRTRVTERLQITTHPAMYVVDTPLYAYMGGAKYTQVSENSVLEGAALSTLRYSLEVRNAIAVNTSVAGWVGSVNAVPLITLAHGAIWARCAMFAGLDTSITLQLGYLPRWTVRAEWYVKNRPWDTPVGLEPFAGNLFVRYTAPGGRDVYVPFQPFPTIDHNMIFSAFSW